MQEHFAEFISDGKSADQIEFVGMVIDHLCCDGIIDPGLLYESPLSDAVPDGPHGVFTDAEVDDFMEHVRTINRSAGTLQSAEAF